MWVEPGPAQARSLCSTRCCAMAPTCPTGAAFLRPEYHNHPRLSGGDGGSEKLPYLHEVIQLEGVKPRFKSQVQLTLEPILPCTRWHLPSQACFLIWTVVVRPVPARWGPCEDQRWCLAAVPLCAWHWVL